jgi:hypothetical protein
MTLRGGWGLEGGLLLAGLKMMTMMMTTTNDVMPAGPPRAVMR